MPEIIRKLRERLSGEPEGMLEEDQLTLNYKKEELFDPHTVLPHPEVNQQIYEAVDRFIQRYRGNALKVTVMTGSLNPSLQKVFREAYFSHYDDEYQKTQIYLQERLVRGILLMLVSLAAFFIGNNLIKYLTDSQLPAILCSQISVFCLWAIGDLHFDRSAARSRKKMILRARDAEIEFM